MALIFEDKVKENKAAFLAKVVDVSKKLEIDPNWLMAVMNSESGLSSRIQNTSYPVGGGYATGLIQFIPSSAKALGTTTEALRNMSNVDQLDYVYKYFKPYKDKILSYIDLYMVTFFPVAVGKKDDYVLQTDTIPAAKIATSNPVFDKNKDKQITVGEVKQGFLSRIPVALQVQFSKSFDTVGKFVGRNWIAITLTSASLIAITVLLFMNKNKIQNL